jgi:predicted nucleic acid-binding protein
VASLIDTSVLVGGITVAGVADGWAVSVITVGELEAGVLVASSDSLRARRVELLAAVIAEAPVLPIDMHVALRYGELRANAGRRPSNDLWIGATALAHDFSLVTADEGQATLPLVRTTLVG